MTFSSLTVDVGNLLLLAQDAGDAPAAGGGQGGAGAEPVSPLGPLLPILAIGLFFYFIMIRPQQREARKRKDLLAAIKKNDKVVTIGGIIGTVVDLSADRVTLRVDDGTRIKFVRSSIQTVYEDVTDTNNSK
ncbi:MAG: preprotein translocase subunit YajC [Planctomycetaceae bacterium]